MSVASSCDDMSVQPEGNVRSLGRLVVVTGLPGSGKTRLGKKLATSMPAIRLCPDDWMMASGIDLWNEVVRSRGVDVARLDLPSCLGDRVDVTSVVEWNRDRAGAPRGDELRSRRRVGPTLLVGAIALRSPRLPDDAAEAELWIRSSFRSTSSSS